MTVFCLQEKEKDRKGSVLRYLRKNPPKIAIVQVEILTMDVDTMYRIQHEAWQQFCKQVTFLAERMNNIRRDIAFDMLCHLNLTDIFGPRCEVPSNYEIIPKGIFS